MTMGNSMTSNGMPAVNQRSIMDLSSMMKSGNLIPTICLSISDAMLLRSMMIHDSGSGMVSMFGANMTGSTISSTP